ncbi:hypothetical protein MMPV_005591 [Pyropia vietnamensis]
MALIGHADRGHGFQKLVLLLIISLTIFGNALEFCRILPAEAECSDRTKALVGIGAVSSGIVLVVLVAKAGGMAIAGSIELLGSVLTLGLWVAAAALVTSAKTAAVVGGDGAAFWGSPAFFASWGGALVALSLTLRAVCDSPMVENLGLKKRRSAVVRSTEAESAKAVDVSNSDEPAAEYA